MNCSNEEIISSRCRTANNFLTRLTGLIGRKTMPDRSSLVLMPCSQVHTFFMRFNIDVIFLDRESRVKLVIEDMPPWRISRLVWGSRVAVEMPGGTLKKRVDSGDLLIFEE